RPISPSWSWSSTKCCWKSRLIPSSKKPSACTKAIFSAAGTESTTSGFNKVSRHWRHYCQRVIANPKPGLVSVKKSINRKWLLVAVLLPLLAACGSTPSKTDAAAAPEISAATRTSFATAVAAMKAEQWAEAERQLKQLLQSQPNLSGVHLDRKSVV